MIGDAPRSYITGVPGWETPDEQALLFLLAQEVPENGVIFEIGSEYGMSASIFAKAAQPRQVMIGCVDLFPGDGINHHRQNLQEAGLESEYIQRYRQDSKLGYVPNRRFVDRNHLTIDLLFIDGDHTYAGCAADIAAWTPHVRVGGKVAFHDTACLTNRQPHALHYEVSNAVADWAEANPNWELDDMVDSIMVFVRRA